MPHVPAPIPTTHTSTFDGTDTLYARFPQTSIGDLRYLLARGSGYVVRGGCMSKSWFQAQCAHYGLPQSGTLAALRNQLELFLAKPPPQVPKALIVLEKQKRDEHTPTPAPISSPESEMKQPQARGHKTEDRVPSESFGNGGDIRPPQHPVPTQDVLPLADKTNLCSTPEATTPKKPSLPRVKHAGVVKSVKSVRWDPVLAENALQEIKLRMGRPERSSGTDTESEGEDDSLRSSDFGPLTPWTTRKLITHCPPRKFVPSTASVISGQWDLSVTCHTMPPLPAPWRTASSKWLNGDMNVQLANDGRSLTGEFTLLGLDGKFKSRKCHFRTDGISAWVRFVAQMPIVTEKSPQDQGDKEHNLIFGPSETQYGYLRFYGEDRVGGMLRCRKYGKLEFVGVRMSGPVDMAWD